MDDGGFAFDKYLVFVFEKVWLHTERCAGRQTARLSELKLWQMNPLKIANKMDTNIHTFVRQQIALVSSLSLPLIWRCERKQCACAASMRWKVESQNVESMAHTLCTMLLCVDWIELIRICFSFLVYCPVCVCSCSIACDDVWCVHNNSPLNVAITFSTYLLIVRPDHGWWRFRGKFNDTS